MLVDVEGGTYLGAGCPKERDGSECSAPAVDVTGGGEPTTLCPILLCASLREKPESSLINGGLGGRFSGVAPAFCRLMIIEPCGLEGRAVLGTKGGVTMLWLREFPEPDTGGGNGVTLPEENVGALWC